MKVWINRLKWQWRCWRNRPRMCDVMCNMPQRWHERRCEVLSCNARAAQWSWSGFLVQERIVPVWPRAAPVFQPTSKTRTWESINA